MERITHWALLWRQVVEARHSGLSAARGPGGSSEADRADSWRDRAPEFDSRVRQRWLEASATRDTLLAHVDSASTVLDVGAGTGAWAIPLARHVASVTALEPSPSMRHLLERNIEAEGVSNVRVVEGRWPEAAVEAHDLVLCSHAMYGAVDLVRFVERLAATARRHCFLIIRAPSRDSLMADAARIAWGHPHFAPDFTIAYNVLLDMGLHPDVLVEPRIRWRTDSSPTIEAALEDVRQRLGLAPDDRALDGALRALLERRLVPRGDRLDWPGTLRSALVHWSTLPAIPAPDEDLPTPPFGGRRPSRGEGRSGAQAPG